MLSVYRAYTRVIHLAADPGGTTLCGRPCNSSAWMPMVDAPATCKPCLRAAGSEKE